MAILLFWQKYASDAAEHAYIDVANEKRDGLDDGRPLIPKRQKYGWSDDDNNDAPGSAGELLNTGHPRFGQRLQTYGAILLVIGVTVHFANLHSVVLAGCLLVPSLLCRLAIELSIKADDTEAVFNKKLEKVQLINQLSCLITFGGLISLLHDK
jgi:hypothetical protein